MRRFQAVSHAEVCSRSLRASVTVTVTVSLDRSPDPVTQIRRRVVPTDRLPRGLREPGVRWDILPQPITPDQWTTGQADSVVPGSILIAQAENRPPGYEAG